MYALPNLLVFQSFWIEALAKYGRYELFPIRSDHNLIFLEIILTVTYDLEIVQRIMAGRS